MLIMMVFVIFLVTALAVYVFTTARGLDERLEALHVRIDKCYEDLEQVASILLENQGYVPTIEIGPEFDYIHSNSELPDSWDDGELPLTAEAEDELTTQEELLALQEAWTESGDLDEPCTGPNCPRLPEHMQNQVPNTGHAIVIGPSGSGKSVTLMALIMDRIIAGQHICLVDTKRELGPYFGPYCGQVVNIAGATKMVQELVDEADHRQTMFENYIKKHKKVVNNINDYNRHSGENLPIITLVLEELIRLTTELDEDFVTAFLKLIAVGRSAGIYILTASQYLNISILPKAASTNFTVKVYLGKFDKTICNQILFSQPLTMEEAKSLGPVGFGIVEINGERSSRQFANVTEAMLEEWLG